MPVKDGRAFILEIGIVLIYSNLVCFSYCNYYIRSNISFKQHNLKDKLLLCRILVENIVVKSVNLLKGGDAKQWI